MANITKRKNKRGQIAYRIRVYTGEDVNGKQRTQSMTWVAPTGMRANSAEKEALKRAILFEQDVKGKRVSSNGKTRFAEYADRVLSTHECSSNTKEQYRYLLKRINDEIGHISLADITQENLRRLYKKLRSEGQRKKEPAVKTVILRQIRKEKGLTQEQVAAMAELSIRTVAQAESGKCISLTSAKRLSKVVDKKLDDLFTTTKNNGKLSEATVWHHHKLIRMILEMARSERIIPYNEAADMKNAPAMPGAKIEHLDDEQAQSFIVALYSEPDIRIKTALMISIYTALRRGELCGLSWPDVDLQRGIIHINKSSQYQRGAGVIETGTKTENSKRTIKLHDDLILIIREYQKWWNEQKLKYGADWSGEVKRLFIQHDGSPICPNTVYRWLQSFLKRNNLPRVSLHSLRHTCLTLLLSTGADIKSIQQLSGHSTAATLLDTYGHFLPSQQESLVNSLGRILTKKLKQA